MPNSRRTENNWPEGRGFYYQGYWTKSTRTADDGPVTVSIYVGVKRLPKIGDEMMLQCLTQQDAVQLASNDGSAKLPIPLITQAPLLYELALLGDRRFAGRAVSRSKILIPKNSVFYILIVCYQKKSFVH